jgi:hypothetical protein
MNYDAVRHGSSFNPQTNMVPTGHPYGAGFQGIGGGPFYGDVMAGPSANFTPLGMRNTGLVQPSPSGFQPPWQQPFSGGALGGYGGFPREDFTREMR